MTLTVEAKSVVNKNYHPTVGQWPSEDCRNHGDSTSRSGQTWPDDSATRKAITWCPSYPSKRKLSFQLCETSQMKWYSNIHNQEILITWAMLQYDIYIKALL